MALSNELPSLSPHIRTNQTTAVALAGVALVPVLSYAYTSYREWLTLGRGGPPYNLLGWMGQGFLQLIARWDTLDASMFSSPRVEEKYKPHGRRRFLDNDNDPLPSRTGGRPRVPGFVAPQRQVTQQGTAETKSLMSEYLHALAAANPDVLTIKPSGLEGVGTPALFVVEISQRASPLRRIRGELAHVHPDGSSHVTLSLADAEEAVRKEWGERHRLSGSAVVGLPWGYLLLYAPRDEAELRTWKALVFAGLQFVCADVSGIRNVYE